MSNDPLDRNTPALALSGGGFRATLYHCGVFIRLNELGYLSKLSRISCVSGGAIAGGMLAAAWSRLVPADGVFTNLNALVIEPLRRFCCLKVDQEAIALGTLFPHKTIGDVLADVYDKHLFSGMSLQDLPDSPQFVFNATNLQTGRLVRMQRSRLADYSIGQILSPDIRLAVAVAASSAFPPVLSPVVLDLDPAQWSDLPASSHYMDERYTKRLSLTDGGAYDNLGLETVDDFNPVIVSDAGAPFGAEEAASGLWSKQALRVLDIATDQSRALRKRLLFATAGAARRTIAFAGIDSEPGAYSAPNRIATDPLTITWIAGLRTRLNPFSALEQGRLLNWGWLSMDLAMRTYVVKEGNVPEALPLPQYPLHG